MPNYVYNVGYFEEAGRQVAWQLDPQHYQGSPANFARTVLVAWLEQNPQHADKLAVVSVWDTDLDGVGVPGSTLARLSTSELDEGPFDPNQLFIQFGHYHILAAGYALLENDSVLGSEGTANRYVSPHGVIVPGAGPAVRIRAGHKYGWITLRVALHGAEPPPETTPWEAVEQVTMGPAGEVRVADDAGRIVPHYPDLAGGRHLHLAIRVSVRGRSSGEPRHGAASPRRTPVEDHLIEAWPTAAAAPYRVLKRDSLSRAIED